MNSSKLQDRIILVTGANGGIGTAITERLLGLGAKVVEHYRSGTPKGEQAPKGAKSGANLFPVQADLTDEAQVERLFSEARRHFGRIDGLVANAGKYTVAAAPVAEMSLVQWNRTLADNLTSSFLCVREFLKEFSSGAAAASAARSAAVVGAPPAIVLIASTAGVFGEADHADYAAAKSALLGGFAKSVKNEIARLHPRGRINVVSPGWTMTEMAREKLADEAAVARVLQTIALRKVGAPADVAASVAFLLDESQSGHMSGENLVLSGGMEGRVLYERGETGV